jgi:hypothetical protein
MATDADIDELKRWLESLGSQIRQLRIDQHIFDEVQKIIASNERLHVPSHFYEWMQDMYVSGIAMAIRRQQDDDARTMSFYRFLKRIKGDPSVVSRTRYRALYNDNNSFVRRLREEGLLESYIDRCYDKLVGNDTADVAKKNQPTAEDIQNEIAELQQTSAKFVEFANKVVAHDDNVKPDVLPTFEEVGVAVKYMETLLQRYIQLFEAAHQSMDLNFQYDWKGIFRVPWLPPERPEH